MIDTSDSPHTMVSEELEKLTFTDYFRDSDEGQLRTPLT
jgi:hypothetical protein